MRIALFITCLADTLYPQTGKAVVRLLERLGHARTSPFRASTGVPSTAPARTRSNCSLTARPTTAPRCSASPRTRWPRR